MPGVDSRRVTATSAERYDVRIEVKVAPRSGISRAEYEAAVEWVNNAEFVIERGEFTGADGWSPEARARRGLPETPHTYPAYRIRLADTTLLDDMDTGWWRSRKDAIKAANEWWLDEVYFAVIYETREIRWAEN